MGGSRCRDQSKTRGRARGIPQKKEKAIRVRGYEDTMKTQPTKFTKQGPYELTKVTKTDTASV